MGNLSEIRTMEEVAYLLNILFVNMNNLSKAYYDVFINPEPMDVTLKRYDENGQVTSVVIPNRAKDKLFIYKGQGNPNGKQTASQGALYLDTTESILYFKGNATNDAYGWQHLWCQTNLVEAGGGTTGQFLSPSGDGQNLTNISASNINNGFLSVERGGTGKPEDGQDRYFTPGALLKGNGYDPITIAQEGIDYLGGRVEDSLIGMIAYFPSEEAHEGWLICDGKEYNSADYPKLVRYLKGVNYSAEKFSVPNLSGTFIRCYDTYHEEGLKVTEGIGDVQEEHVGTHTHIVSGDGIIEPHSHTVPVTSFLKETDSSTGRALQERITSPSVEVLGSSEVITTSSVGMNIDITGEAQENESGEDGSTENRPKNVALVAMIRCDIVRG